MINQIAHESLNEELYLRPDLDVTGDMRFYGLSLYHYVRKLDDQTASKIRILAVVGTNVVARAICEIIGRCREIEVIKLGPKQISKELLEILAFKMKNVKELWLENINFSKGTISPCFMCRLKHLDLFIKNPRMLVDDRTICTLFMCLNLKGLEIQGNEQLTDIALNKIIHQCKELEYLNVSKTKTMSDPTCDLISKHITNLKRIDVRDTEISARGIQVLETAFKARGLDPEKCLIANRRCLVSRQMSTYLQSSYAEGRLVTAYQTRSLMM